MLENNHLIDIAEIQNYPRHTTLQMCLDLDYRNSWHDNVYQQKNSQKQLPSFPIHRLL